jgi:hypothetical protein
MEEHPGGVSTPPIMFYPIATDSGRYQNLYPADEFTGNPPYGRIKNIYLRTGIYGPYGSNVTIYNVNFRLGYSNLSNLDTVNSLFTNLTLVSHVDSLTSDTVLGGWIKIPLNMENTNFYFDPNQNLILGMDVDSGGVDYANNHYIVLLRSYRVNQTFTNYYISGLTSGSALVEKDRNYFDFGFDLYPTDVEDITKLTDFTIYPSPAPSGKFTVQFNTKKTINEGTLTVSSITGKEILHEKLGKIAGSFSKTVSLSEAAKGIYFVELVADGERIVRKIVVE